MIILYIELRLSIRLDKIMSLLLYYHYHIVIIILPLIYNIILYYNIDYTCSSLACFGEGLYYYLEAFFLYI